jgi:long-chain acyl-CoA synthetase
MSTAVEGRSASALAGPGDIVGHAAARDPGKVALIAGGRELTYGELDDLCARAAAGLRARGVAPGQVVTLYGPNSWQWVVAYHAVLRAGAVVNPINVMLTPPEVAYVLGDCGAVAVLTSGAQLGAMRELTAGLPGVRLVLGLDLEPGEDEAFAGLFGYPPLTGAEPVDPDALSTIGYTSGRPGTRRGRCSRSGRSCSTAR